MNQQILYSYLYLHKTKKKIKKKISILKKIHKRSPKIAIIVIGKNKLSNIYIKKKCFYFKIVGIKYKIYKYSKNIKEKKIFSKIKKINKNKKIDCLLIQLPIPKHLNTNKIINKINPCKDVDGLHALNIGKLSQGNSKIHPCTSFGVIKLLKYYKINLIGLNTLIIGSSNLVGKPMSMELINKGCTVTLTNTKTKNIKKYIKNADLLISAIGKYNKYPTYWIKKKCIIIDIGINKINNKIIGDINFKLAIKRAKYITPTPGGIGLMTISILLKNIVKIYIHNNKY